MAPRPPFQIHSSSNVVTLASGVMNQLKKIGCDTVETHPSFGRVFKLLVAVAAAAEVAPLWRAPESSSLVNTRNCRISGCTLVIRRWNGKRSQRHNADLYFENSRRSNPVGGLLFYELQAVSDAKSVGHERVYVLQYDRLDEKMMNNKQISFIHG